MLSDSDTLNWHGIDLFQVSTLEPRVYRYYMKGVLSGLCEIVLKSSEFDDIPFEFWQWIEHSNGIKDTSFEKLAAIPQFSKSEIEGILSLVMEIYKLRNDDEQKKGDIQNTIQFWEAYLKALL